MQTRLTRALSRCTSRASVTRLCRRAPRPRCPRCSGGRSSCAIRARTCCRASWWPAGCARDWGEARSDQNQMLVETRRCCCSSKVKVKLKIESKAKKSWRRGSCPTTHANWRSCAEPFPRTARCASCRLRLRQRRRHRLRRMRVPAWWRYVRPITMLHVQQQ